MIRKSFLLISLIVLPFVHIAFADQIQKNGQTELKTLLNKIKKAVGYENFKNIDGKAIRATGEFNQNNIKGKFERVSDQGKIVMNVSGKLPMKMGFDGKKYWMTGLSSIPVYQSLNSENLLKCSEWIGMYRWLEGKVSPFEVVIAKKQEDTSSIVLDIQQRNGPFQCTLNIDKKSFLPVKMRMVDRGMEKITEYSDYRGFAGVRMPYRSDLIQPKTEQVISTILSDISFINKPSAEVFEIPTYDLKKDIEVKNKKSVSIDIKKTFTGHILIKASLGSDKKYWFLLDSGAEGMVLDTKVADELKMKRFGKTGIIGVSGIASASFHRGVSIHLGELELKNQLWMVTDLSFLKMLGEDIKGVIGYELFARRIVEMNLRDRKIFLHPPETYKLKKSTWQNFNFDGKLPVLSIRFEKKQGDFMLDSGAGKMIVFGPQSVKKYNLLEKRKTRSVMLGGAGESGPKMAKSGMIESIAIGQLKIKQSMAVFLEQDDHGPMSTPFWTGVVGAALFENSVIVYNYPDSKIAFVQF